MRGSDGISTGNAPRSRCAATTCSRAACPSPASATGGQWLDMDSGAYSRTFTVHFSYRFGSYKGGGTKEVDTSRFGH